MILYNHQYVLLLRSTFVSTFGDGNLNLLPTSACLNAFQQLCIYLLVSLFCTWSDLGRVVWPELDIQSTNPCLVLTPLLLSEVWLEELLMWTHSVYILTADKIMVISGAYTAPHISRGPSHQKRDSVVLTALSHLHIPPTFPSVSHSLVGG